MTLSEAVLGAGVEVPTLDGKALLKVPGGTQNGSVLRMRGKGIISQGDEKQGDMYVHVIIEVPKNLNKKARGFFEELRKFEHDPRKEKF